MVRGKQGAHGNGLVNAAECLTTEVTVQLKLFGGFCGQTNLGHFFNGFKRVFARCGFSAQHDSVGAIEHRIGHIANLRARRHGIGDHAFHHLCGRDDHFVVLTRQLDHAFLQSRHHRVADFNRQVTAGHHDAVAGQQNFF